MVSTSPLKIGEQVSPDRRVLADEHGVGQCGFLFRPQQMDLLYDVAASVGSPPFETASRKSRKQFHLRCFGRSQHHDTVFGEVARIVESARIAEVVRPVELGGKTNSLSVAKFVNGVRRVPFAIKAGTNA